MVVAFGVHICACNLAVITNAIDTSGSSLRVPHQLECCIGQQDTGAPVKISGGVAADDFASVIGIVYFGCSRPGYVYIPERILLRLGQARADCCQKKKQRTSYDQSFVSHWDPPDL